MSLDNTAELPPAWRRIRSRSAELGFAMASDADTGALLRVLAASKPGGRLLELGTGTGLATACLLAGMDAAARLTSLDIDPRAQGVARETLGDDPRVTFILGDALAHLRAAPARSVDLVFADAWPGKFEGAELALNLLRPGGLYVVDDMLPQPNWPPDHQAHVDRLVARLAAAAGMSTAMIGWSTGLIVSARGPGG